MNLMFWKKKAVQGDEAEGNNNVPAAEAVTDLAADVLEEAATLKAAHFKKRLLVFGMLGLLILILSGLVFAAWKIFFSSKPQKAPPPAAAVEEKLAQPSPHDKKNLIKLPAIDLPKAPAHETTAPRESAPQTELEALRKKNEALEGQLKALKQGEATVPSAPMQQRGAPAAGGEVVLDSKDPKATAMTLKAAIEQMNAITGDYAKKPAAQTPVKKASP